MKKAADLGDSYGAFNYAEFLQNGEHGIKVDRTLSAFYYKIAADKGNAKAAYMLGEKLYSADGIPKNLEDAIKYWTIAAEGEDANALYTLGSIHQNGIGFKENFEKSLEYYIRAADAGHAAQYTVGYSYMTGDGLPQNIKTGLVYLFKAAKQENADAIQALEKLKSKGIHIPDWSK